MFLMTALYSTNNKNSKTDIGIQAEDPRSKAAKPPKNSYVWQCSNRRDNPLNLRLNLHTAANLRHLLKLH